MRIFFGQHLRVVFALLERIPVGFDGCNGGEGFFFAYTVCRCILETSQPLPPKTFLLKQFRGSYIKRHAVWCCTWRRTTRGKVFAQSTPRSNYLLLGELVSLPGLVWDHHAVVRYIHAILGSFVLF